MKIEDFLQKDGSLKIPKNLVPFVDFVKEPIPKVCFECGDTFLQTHQKQRFCPPAEGIKRSRCENTHNQRLKRQKKKQKREMEK